MIRISSLIQRYRWSAYERYVNEDDEKERGQCLNEHLNSIRGHIKNLSEKNYQHLYGVSGLDFVLLFMPVEPAFSLAVQNDDQLFKTPMTRIS